MGKDADFRHMVMNCLPTNSPFPRRITFLSSNLLRILAVILMTLDHLWASIVPGNAWLTYVGRLSFPLFAFLIAEGFVHTSNRRKYILRILLFALLSEIPFDLLCEGFWLYPFHQNVLFTFLYALLAMTVIDRFRRTRTWGSGFRNGALLLLILLASWITFPDYGFWGVATVLMFYLVRDFPFAFLVQFALMFYMHVHAVKGEILIFSCLGHSFAFPKQGLAILALPLIWLYSGKRGKKSKLLQYGFYAYYPVHSLLLWLLSTLV